MPRSLKNLVIEEVSSVDRGAGRGVKALLFKRDRQNADDVIIDFNAIREVAKSGGADALAKSKAQAAEAFNAAVMSIAKDEKVADKAAEIAKAYDEYQSFLSGLAPASTENVMTPEQIQKSIDEAVKKGVETALASHAADIAKKDLEIAVLKMPAAHQEFCKAMSAEDKAKFAAKTDKERDDECAKANAAPALPEHVTKALAEAAEDRKVLKGLQEQAEIRKYEDKATGLGLDKKHGEVLRKAYSGDAKAQGELDGLLKGLAEQARTGKVFDEFGAIGKSQAGVTAHDELVVKADEIRKSEPKLTKEQAYVKAAELHPDLFAKVRAEEISKVEKMAAA